MPAEEKSLPVFCYMVCLVYSFHFKHWNGLTFFFLSLAQYKKKRELNANGVRKIKQKACSPAESGPKELFKLGPGVLSCIIFRRVGCGCGVLHLLQKYEQMKEKKKKEVSYTLLYEFP